MQKILVAIDGSEYSKKALEFACRLADKFEAVLRIVHIPQGAASDYVMVLGAAAVTLHADREQIEEAGRAAIEAARQLAESRVPGRVETELRGGDPANEIVACATENDVDCIVIGNRGLGDFGGLLLGSVSHKVNHNAPCTCITVH